MPCDLITDDQGRPIAIACSRGRRKKCEWCGSLSKFQCDGPPAISGRKTCDAHMCAQHRKNVGSEKDLCPRCAAKEEEMPACSSCGAEIEWVTMRDSGKRMPVDAKPASFVVLVASDGSPVVSGDGAKGVVVTGRLSHFATCPDADKHRRKP